MPVQSISCPSCQAVLKLPENVPAGAKTNCPKCRAPITVPASSPQANTQSAVAGDSSQQERTEAASAHLDAASGLDAPRAPDELGRLGPYRVLRKLGEGGMGMVYEAEDTELRRRIALKVMLPQHAANPTARARFLREARAQAAVEHEHVAAIFLVGDDQAVPYIAMPLLKGRTLQAALKESPNPPVSEVIRIGQEMAEGLGAAHAIGLIHRDIKPANIWLEGSKRKVKVLDFGLARATADAQVDVDESEGPKTAAGSMLGTPAYMSPEQGRGETLDARSDLFSLGIVMYEMAAAERPFKGKDIFGILTSLAVDQPAPPRPKNAAVPRALSDLILKLLAKKPEDRPQSAQAVADVLREIEEAMKQQTAVVATPVVVANDPWADIEVTEPGEVVHLKASGWREPPDSGRRDPADQNRGAHAHRSPKNKKLLFAGLAGLLAVVALGAVIIKITNKDGTVAELKVPDGSKVEVTHGGKTTVVVDPNAKKNPIVKEEPKKVDLPPYVPVEFSAAEAKKQQEEWAAKMKVPVEATNGIGMKLVLIPPAGAALPKPYYLGKYEVTQAEWEKLMGSNPSDFSAKGRLKTKVEGMDTSQFPVDSVSWYASLEFCNKMSEKDGLKPYYEVTILERSGTHIAMADVKILGGRGYHIPTDAEWEHGCRAGTKKKYHFGDRDEELPEYGWFLENSDGSTHVVGGKRPNGFGLYDMYGNVREWNEEALTNAKTGERIRNYRGGAWYVPAANSAVSIRQRASPSAWFNYFGLRLARTPESQTQIIAPPAYVPVEFSGAEAKKQQEDWAAKLKVQVEATNGIGMKLILIPPAGTALPKPYYLGKYEVTQAEWTQVMGSNPSSLSGKNARVTGLDTSRFPVEQISWFDSVEFCNKLSEKEGLKPYYELKVDERNKGGSIEKAEVKFLGGSGYHIPTDAEWEHGCRAGTKTRYHFGDKVEDLLQYAWFVENSDDRTHAVGEKRPNGFGLYDMHGNVREWNEEMLTNATTGAPERVARGGYWKYTAGHCAVSTRARLGPANRSSYYGFRVARTPVDEAPQAVKPPAYVPVEFSPADAKKQQEEWAAKLKVPVEATNGVGMKLVLIPPAGEALPKPYYLGKYEVTQAEWEKIMGSNPSLFKPGHEKIVELDTSRFPVEQVNWFDSVEFCNKLSEKEGLKPYYALTVQERKGPSIENAEVKILGGCGYCIPTDAEWEHGCRAGAKGKYHFGDRDEDLPEYGWVVDNSVGRTHAVGGKRTNAFGLFDMHGNVREWNEEMLTNATTGAPERVPRGGYWNSPAGTCAVSNRYRNGPAARNANNGLRLARYPVNEVPQAAKPPAYVPVELSPIEAKKQQEEWAAKLKLPVEATNGIGMKLVLIPPTGEALPKPYYLGRYEVTQAEWTQVMGSNPSSFSGKNAKVAGLDTNRFPVEIVNWFDGVEFCNKLSKKEGLKPY